MSQGVLNPYDDHLSYLGHINMVRGHGWINDPFNLRRLASHGLQTYFQAPFVAHFGERGAFLFERTVVSTLLGVLFWILFAQRPLIIRIPIVFSVLWVEASTNLAPHLSGFLAYLCFVVALLRLQNETLPRKKRIAILLAGFSLGLLLSLRANYLIAMILPGLILLQRPTASFLKSMLGVTFIGLLFALPFAIFSYLSSGTLLFPIFKGNLVADFGALQSQNGSNHGIARMLVETVQNHRFVLMAVTGVTTFFFDKKNRMWVLSLWGLACVSILAIVLSYKNLGFSSDVIRYSYPFMMGSLYLNVFFLSGVQGQFKLQRALICLVLLVSIFNLAANAFLELRVAIQTDSSVANSTAGFDHFRKEYLELQSKIPPGTRLLSAVDHPFLFDFERNQIFQMDIPGAASPRGEKIDFSDLTQTLKLLRDAGVDFFVFVDPEFAETFYRRDWWRTIQQESEQELNYLSDWRVGFLKYFQFLNSLIPQSARYGRFYVYKL